MILPGWQSRYNAKTAAGHWEETEVSTSVDQLPTGIAGGERISITATDGHVLNCWRVAAAGDSTYGVVVLQEIFGVNAHVREVCARFASSGATAISPALFDRVEPGVELGYDDAGIEKGRKLREGIGWAAAICDVEAAVRAAGPIGPVAVIGFCWGGTLAFLASTRIEGISCAVSYYGGQTVPFAKERIRVPVLMHFGESDPRIPEADRACILENNPDIEAHVYPADHGFNCSHRKQWHEPSATLAMSRTMDFLARHLPMERSPNISMANN